LTRHHSWHVSLPQKLALPWHLTWHLTRHLTWHLTWHLTRHHPWHLLLLLRRTRLRSHRSERRERIRSPPRLRLLLLLRWLLLLLLLLLLLRLRRTPPRHGAKLVGHFAELGVLRLLLLARRHDQNGVVRVRRIVKVNLHDASEPVFQRSVEDRSIKWARKKRAT
jgi:hypothetical protein